jgi:hypothetical protein
VGSNTEDSSMADSSMADSNMVGSNIIRMTTWSRPSRRGYQNCSGRSKGVALSCRRLSLSDLVRRWDDTQGIRVWLHICHRVIAAIPMIMARVKEKQELFREVLRYSSCSAWWLALKYVV